MKFVITVFGLAFCVATAGATPVSTLSAGLYTFSNISCAGVGCADITASVSTQSTSEYGGISAITFSDNGSVAQQSPGAPLAVQLNYVVSYSGLDPRSYFTSGYFQTFSGTSHFLGFEPVEFEVQDTEGGVLVGGTGFTYPEELYSELFENVAGMTSFSVLDTLVFGPSASNVASPGEFTTTYAAVDSPEPSSSGLCTILLGALIFAGLRRRKRML